MAPFVDSSTAHFDVATSTLLVHLETLRVRVSIGALRDGLPVKSYADGAWTPTDDEPERPALSAAHRLPRSHPIRALVDTAPEDACVLLRCS